MSDLIDRQATIKDLYTINPQILLRSLNNVEYFLEAQPSVQQWIPVSERLPENPPTIFDIKAYLVCKDFGGMQVVVWCDGWNCTMDFNGVISKKNEIKGIVAWMPLPEPYKEEQG